MENIAVIDYHMGNLRSVAKALEHVVRTGQRVVVTDDPAVVQRADRLVFPGQGAMRDCMAEIRSRNLTEVLTQGVASKPFLGICMGLQALMEWSEESPDTPGFGILSGPVRRLPDRDPQTGARLKIPHMGWNQVRTAQPHPLWEGIPSGERFYFVHSYYVDPSEPSVVAGTTDYGVRFVCAIARANLFAVQFHPEKSQHAGLTLLANFLRWSP